MSHHTHDNHSDGAKHMHAAPGSYELIETQDHSDELGHASPFSLYRNSFGALLFLTVVTVGVAQFDFGSMNVVVALLIASIKAMIVALFFMHLKFEKPTTWLYALFPMVLLVIMIGGVFIDNPLRTHVEPIKVKSEKVTEAPAVLNEPAAAPAHATH